MATAPKLQLCFIFSFTVRHSLVLKKLWSANVDKSNYITIWPSSIIKCHSCTVHCKPDKTWLQGHSLSHLITESLKRLITLFSPLHSIFSSSFVLSSFSSSFHLTFSLCSSSLPTFYSLLLFLMSDLLFSFPSCLFFLYSLTHHLFYICSFTCNPNPSLSLCIWLPFVLLASNTFASSLLLLYLCVLVSPPLMIHSFPYFSVCAFPLLSFAFAVPPFLSLLLPLFPSQSCYIFLNASLCLFFFLLTLSDGSIDSFCDDIAQGQPWGRKPL